MCCIANYTSSTIRDSLFRGDILGSLAVHFNGLSNHLSGSRVGHIVFIGCLWDEAVDTDDGGLVLTIAAAQGDQYSQTSEGYHYRKGLRRISKITVEIGLNILSMTVVGGRRIVSLLKSFCRVALSQGCTERTESPRDLGGFEHGE